jgi:hypothetical protein
VLGALIAADCLADVRLRALEVVEPLSGPAATAALQLRVRGGWAAFTDPGMFADLCDLHAVLRRSYAHIATACLTGAPGRWRRPLLDPGQAAAIRLPLSQATRKTLAHFLSALRPELLAESQAFADPSNRSWTTHVYPLADLAYSVCFSSHDGELSCHVRLNLFSDLGGAGVSVINGVIVKIRKGVGTLTGDELAARRTFQRDYLTALRCHPELGQQALYPTIASA